MTIKRERPLFAQNVIMKRSKLGWTAEVLSEKAGIGYNTLRDIETGVSGGTPRTKAAIAQALGCTVDDLHQKIQPNSSPSPTIQDLAKVITELTSQLEKAKASNQDTSLTSEESELLILFRQARAGVRNTILDVVRKTIAFDNFKPGATKRKRA